MATIYCVEDDSGIQELILCALQSGGYTPVGFYNGADFFEKLQVICIFYQPTNRQYIISKHQ